MLIFYLESIQYGYIVAIWSRCRSQENFPTSSAPWRFARW